MLFIPYKANECFEHLYYQIPMELFENDLYKDKLNSDAKLLYGFLLNRLLLSAKNNWIDEDGTIYLIFSRKDVQKLLNLSDKTVTKAFKQLGECNLISEKRQGVKKPNKIYVGKILHDPKLTHMIRKKYDSRLVKSTNHESENLRPNYNNKSYNYKNKNSNRFFDENSEYSKIDFSKFYL